MFLPEKALQRTLHFSLSSSRGGPKRAQILLALRTKPLNTNQLSTKLHVDYTTMMYHLRVLKRNGFVVIEDKPYDARVSLSPLLQKNVHLLDDIGKAFLTRKEDE